MTGGDFAAYAGGVAVIMGATVSAGLNIATYLRLGRVEKSVNGLGDKRVLMAVRAGDAEGHARGMTDERDNPLSPA